MSVVLPVHSGGSYLPEPLASLALQSLAGMEVLIVEDGSTDGTLHIVLETERQPDVRASYQRTNQGAAVTARTSRSATATTSCVRRFSAASMSPRTRSTPTS